MVSFYPGPSRIHDAVPTYVRDAARDGILSMNHRSPEFVSLSKQTARLLKQRLRIPSSYTIVYTSSATECWEIIAQSLGEGSNVHYFNGAFGQKWFEYTRKLKQATAHQFDRELLLEPAKLDTKSDGVLCVTHNETSNGTQVSIETLKEIKKLNPGQLVAVDATSSMGGYALDFNAADIWFASVQKCFGLPAGMGIMILSKQAVEWARRVNERSHYNSLPFMLDMAEKWQTSYTPNVLGIYLLKRTLEKSPSILTTHKELLNRYRSWIEFFDAIKELRSLINNQEARSLTVIPISGTPKLITRVKREAKMSGFLLGEGYGDLKETTFRIANFPAIRRSEISTLKKILKEF